MQSHIQNISKISLNIKACLMTYVYAVKKKYNVQPLICVGVELKPA